MRPRRQPKNNEREISFVTKQYGWRWCVWIKVNGKKMLISNNLKSLDEVEAFIESLGDNPLELLQTDCDNNDVQNPQ